MLLERRRVVSADAALNEEAARPTFAGALDTETRTLHPKAYILAGRWVCGKGVKDTAMKIVN